VALLVQRWWKMNFGIVEILKLLMEALLRIEKKVDEGLKLLMKPQQATASGGIPELPPLLAPMNSPTPGGCPLCQKQVTYYQLRIQTDNNGAEVPMNIRVCGCAPTVTQLPINQGDIPS